MAKAYTIQAMKSAQVVNNPAVCVGVSIFMALSMVHAVFGRHEMQSDVLRCPLCALTLQTL